MKSNFMATSDIYFAVVKIYFSLMTYISAARYEVNNRSTNLKLL